MKRKSRLVFPTEARPIIKILTLIGIFWFVGGSADMLTRACDISEDRRSGVRLFEGKGGKLIKRRLNNKVIVTTENIGPQEVHISESVN